MDCNAASITSHGDKQNTGMFFIMPYRLPERLLVQNHVCLSHVFQQNWWAQGVLH